MLASLKISIFIRFLHQIWYWQLWWFVTIGSFHFSINLPYWGLLISNLCSSFLLVMLLSRTKQKNTPSILYKCKLVLLVIRWYRVSIGPIGLYACICWKNCDFVRCNRCLTHSETENKIDTQLVWSLKFKLSHAMLKGKHQLRHLHEIDLSTLFTFCKLHQITILVRCIFSNFISSSQKVLFEQVITPG